MDILWSPWRMAYIGGGGGGDGCIFCTIPEQGSEHDRENLLLLRGEHAFVILNRYPYNSGHLMIVPYRHLRDVTLLTPAESAEIMALLQRMVSALTAVYRPEGFNTGMNLGSAAGAGIADHLHMHIVPRWAGDTNFMPVVGQTKVLPESLEQTWERITSALREF
ncbi:MAG: HIT family protein [Chloroflexia bacterium]